MQEHPFAHCVQHQESTCILIWQENIQVIIIFLDLSEKDMMKTNARLLMPVKFNLGVKHEFSVVKTINC